MICKSSQPGNRIIGLSVMLTMSSALWGAETPQGYQQTNLVSDIPGLAAHTDTNLVNAWGLVTRPKDLLIVNTTESSLTAFYTDKGERVNDYIEVDEEPTGLVWNSSRQAFKITDGSHSGPSLLIFVTEEGKILGWNPRVNATEAIAAVDNSRAEAVYKGVALGSGRGGPRLYAANFKGGVVEVYDGHWKLLGSFTDPNVDPGFAPFNVANINGLLYVTFAKKAPPAFEDDERGEGNGFVDIFLPNGHLLRRLISHGPLNSPWGITRAPSHFGQFSRALLVGNFGDGRINAFHPRTGAFLGPLADAQGKPITIEGLWALQFGVKNADLYFTAGPGDETHGLVGEILVAGAEDKD